jgi:hypothetical protein
MKARALKVRNAVFYVLVVLFAVIVASIARIFVNVPFAVTVVLAIVFGLLGLVLVVLSARLPGTRIQKIFLILTGGSAASMPIFAVLHNVVYGLLIALFGEGFWERHGSGGDEPVFFVLAILVCPALFLIGTVASIVLLVKARIAKQADVPQPEGPAE